MPNRSDVEARERELLEVQPALLGGSIVTFDDLFVRIARGGGGETRPVATEAQRALIVRRALAGHSLNGLGPSARFGGFADALLSTVGELESGLLDPNDLDGELAALYAAYRAELDRLGLWDRDLLRRHAANRVLSELDAWAGEPVFAYGFEDLTGAEWALLEALAGRGEVTVSMPYEPGRAAFASLRRTWKISALSPTAASRNCLRHSSRSPSLRSRTSSARCSPTPGRQGRRSTARSGSSRAPGSAVRSSSSAKSCSACCGPASPPKRSGSSARRSTAGRRRCRRRCSPSACPMRSRRTPASTRRRTARRS